MANQTQVSEAVKTHFELDKAIKAAHELQDQVLKGAQRFEPRCSLEDSSSESEYEGTDDESPMDIDNEFSAFVGDRNFPSVARKKPSASGSPIGSDDSPPGLSLPSVLPSRDQRSIFPRPLKFNPAVMDQRPMRPIGWQANRSTFKKKVRRQQQAGTTDKAKSIAASKLFKAQHRVVSTDINISTLKANSCLMGKEQKVYTLEELKEQGYEVVGWEGV